MTSQTTATESLRDLLFRALLRDLSAKKITDREFAEGVASIANIS